MRVRRLVLVAAFTLFVVALLHPTRGVCAGGPADFEAMGVAGSSPGHLSCGPDVRVRYAGAGGMARVHFREDPNTHQGAGVFLGAGAAVEQVAMAPLRDTEVSGIPGPYPEGALEARVGYDDRPVGVHAGAIFFLSRDRFWWPELAFRFGRVDAFHASVGLGAYDAPTLLHPGLWAGAALPLGAGWELGLHVGLHGNFGDEYPVRTQGTVRMPLTRTLWLQSGLAASVTARGWGPESSLGVGGRL